MLRRHSVSGGIGSVIEYYGPGLTGLSAMDRHVIANMGAELGATATVFPSDGEVHRFLKAQGRESDWTELVADRDADYDMHEEIDLSRLEPLIAMPSSLETWFQNRLTCRGGSNYGQGSSREHAALAPRYPRGSYELVY